MNRTHSFVTPLFLCATFLACADDKGSQTIEDSGTDANAVDVAADRNTSTDGASDKAESPDRPSYKILTDGEAVELDGGSIVIVAAGDLTGERGVERATAVSILFLDLVENRPLSTVLPLGDDAYWTGTLEEFQTYYAPTWGQPSLLAITHPIPGNHEYWTDHTAQGYFDYFNGVAGAADAGTADAGATSTGMAGERGKGWYSFDLGGWHFIALNSNDTCKYVPCDADSEQVAWLQADIADHPQT
jgi:hypothetical protein